MILCKHVQRNLICFLLTVSVICVFISEHLWVLLVSSPAPRENPSVLLQREIKHKQIKAGSRNPGEVI